MTSPDTSPGMMRRVVVSAEGIDVVQAEIPRPGRDEVLVRSVVTGVCGSDTHAAHGRHPFISLPYHPGHEVVGVVAETGPGVTSVTPGQRVTVEPDLPCWQCKQCTRGDENLCENLRFFGCVHDQGGMADFFTIDARRLHVLPDDVDYRSAALIEPLSTPVHAVRLAGGVAGRAVAILGAGSIGLLLLRTVVAQQPKHVVVTDPLPEKRRRALELGADAAIDATNEDAVDQVRTALGESADVVFDCVAVEPTVRQAIGMASKGGTVVIVGVPTSDVSIPLAIIQDYQIRIQGSATYLPQDYADSIDLLIRGHVRADDFITSVVPLESVAEAFRQSASGEHVKVLVTVDPARMN
jgi:2-desacetyl-2-hydroxyethyl bacteriochlorophyllide A dehydrogenase